MKNIYNKVFVTLIILSAISIIYILYIHQHKNKPNNENNTKSIEKSINYFNNTVLKNIDEFDDYFKDRYVTINNSELKIGKNKNELDNDYYDVNFKIKEKSIEIYINKLFKEFNKNMICDEVYVDEIIEYIIKVFNLRVDKTYFKKLIISNYEIIRDVDRKNVNNVDKSVEINNIYISITLYENMLVLKIGDK